MDKNLLNIQFYNLLKIGQGLNICETILYLFSVYNICASAAKKQRSDF